MSTTTQNQRSPRRLVLCFDGTGNCYSAKESDTNIVKLYEMLDRSDNSQFHYYQPGIGTFTTGSSGQALGFLGRLKAQVEQIIDQAIATSFEYHVSKGYEFLMKYYSPGDYIYVFGFSRGAYTARFLAEMIHDIGLLSQGNEEMIRFVYSTFSEAQKAKGSSGQSQKDLERKEYMRSFREAFCRPHMMVHFLGLFDCVNSVGQFEIPFRRKSYRYLGKPPAKHIRHAISIHERRLKFKPSLFLYAPGETDDLKEVWFAGNHADVGGGFSYEGGIKHLLSDTPLAWMVDELQTLDDAPEAKLKFNKRSIQDHGHIQAGHTKLAQSSKVGMPRRSHEQTIKARRPHDFLSFDRGASWFGTISWWILEVLPVFTRLELEHGQWVPRYWPPNMGAKRDLPEEAVIHESVQQMYNAGVISEMPKLGGDEPPILQNPFGLLRTFLSWNMKPSGTDLLRKSKMEVHGAQVWAWGD